jgi:membrane dipeptidase
VAAETRAALATSTIVARGGCPPSLKPLSEIAFRIAGGGERVKRISGRRDVPTMHAKTVALHPRIIVGNMHDDFGLEIAKAREEHQRTGLLDSIYLERMVRGGVDFQFYTVGGDDRHFTGHHDLLLGTLRRFDSFLDELEDSPHFVLARKTADIYEARRLGKRALLVTIEGAEPLGEDLFLLRQFYRLGMRSVCLCWFKANPAADGCGERRNGGLSNFGRALVAEMNRLGMLIDISQCGHQTVADVLDASTRPVMASHSNAGGQYPHRRNLTDEELRRLADSGGIIGLTSFPAHVADGEPTLEQFLDHFDYVVKFVGVDHVGVGLNIIPHTVEVAEAFYKRADIEYSGMWLRQLEDIDRLPALTEGLLRRGYTESQVEKIMGANLLRVLQAAID